MFKLVLLTAGSALMLSSHIHCKSKAATPPPVLVSDNLAIPALLERKGELARAEEWEKTKEKLAALNLNIAKARNDVKSRLQIAVIYMSEARITGEHPYYYPAVLKILDGVLAIDGDNFEAIVYKASVKLSQHRFAEAKLLAEKAMSIRPDNAYVYGVLVDANVELGNYEEAVKMSDKMQALKPSLESYSRASYLREIYGDYPGAIEAMKMAVQAGVPGSEPWCWSKKTLGHLYQQVNRGEDAARQYEEILAVRPSYAFALEGQARMAKRKKDWVGALVLLQKAAAIMPEFSFHEEMAEIYALQGDTKKSEETFKEVLAMLKEDEQSGHAVALEMCRIYTKTGQYELAIAQAMQEYRQRPLNIDVNHALAWTYYLYNDRAKAREFLSAALKTGSKDPELQARAILIKKQG